MSQCRHTSHNKRFSEMAVGVETQSHLLPMTLCGSSSHGAPIRHIAKPPGVIRNENLGRPPASMRGEDDENENV